MGDDTQLLHGVAAIDSNFDCTDSTNSSDRLSLVAKRHCLVARLWIGLHSSLLINLGRIAIL